MEMPDTIYARFIPERRNNSGTWSVFEIPHCKWGPTTRTVKANHERQQYHHDRIVEALRRENEELQAKLDKANWQPIETAPKEGETKALYGCYKNGKWYTQITARGSGVGGLHVNVPTGFRSYTGATHWMPLPEPPK